MQDEHENSGRDTESSGKAARLALSLYPCSTHGLKSRRKDCFQSSIPKEAKSSFNSASKLARGLHSRASMLTFAFFSKVFEKKRLLAVKGSVHPLFNNFRFTLNVCFVNHDSTVLDLFSKIEFIQMPGQIHKIALDELFLKIFILLRSDNYFGRTEINLVSQLSGPVF